MSASGKAEKAKKAKTKGAKPRVRPRHKWAAAKACGDEMRRRLVINGRRRATVLVGGIRRRSPTVKDIDILVFGDLGAVTLRRGGGRATIVKVYAEGPKRTSILVRRNGALFHIDLFSATRAARPYALMHHTGHATYNIRVRAHAKSRGWLLNQYGLFIRGTTRRVPGTAKIKTERELAKFLGITYRAPHHRNEGS